MFGMQYNLNKMVGKDGIRKDKTGQDNIIYKTLVFILS